MIFLLLEFINLAMDMLMNISLSLSVDTPDVSMSTGTVTPSGHFDTPFFVCDGCVRGTCAWRVCADMRRRGRRTERAQYREFGGAERHAHVVNDPYATAMSLMPTMPEPRDVAATMMMMLDDTLATLRYYDIMPIYCHSRCRLIRC